MRGDCLLVIQDDRQGGIYLPLLVRTTSKGRQTQAAQDEPLGIWPEPLLALEQQSPLPGSVVRFGQRAQVTVRHAGCVAILPLPL
jgi:hypothetical protein